MQIRVLDEQQPHVLIGETQLRRSTAQGNLSPVTGADANRALFCARSISGRRDCSAEPTTTRNVAVIIAAKKNGVDEAEHAGISCWMRPHRATKAISAGRLQLESYQKL
jgi:hypothetical protein